MRTSCRKRIVGAAVLAGIFFLGGVLPASAGQYVLADRQTVTNPELDSMRGGYVTDSGFQISLGITKAVFVDGVLQTVSSLTIPDLANRRYADTATIVQNYGQLSVPQAGGLTILNNNGLTVIQNSLDKQVIQHQTIVDVTTNSISIVRQMNTTSQIRQQFINMLH